MVLRSHCDHRATLRAVLANALTDLLRGRDTAEVLSWIQGRPAALRLSPPTRSLRSALQAAQKLKASNSYKRYTLRR